MRSKHMLVFLMMLVASIAGCLEGDKISEEEVDDTIDDVIDGTNNTTTTTTDEVGPGALFVYIMSEEHPFGMADVKPLWLDFNAPPMTDNEPYLLEQICSVDDGHVHDVFSSWVNSSGGNAGDFNNITSWGVENNNSMQLGKFVYDPMYDIIGFTNPMVVFEDNSSGTGGFVMAEVFDQAEWLCTDATTSPSNGTDDSNSTSGNGTVDPDDLEDCPFDDPASSPCAEPECIEDHESDACMGIVEAYCEDDNNSDDAGCDFMDFAPIFEFLETVEERDATDYCGILDEMGSRTTMVSPMDMEGTMMSVTIDILWEYDETASREMMMFTIGSGGMAMESGNDMIQAVGTDYPWIYNLHVVSTDEEDMSTDEHMLILRDMEAEPMEVCPEDDDEDDSSSAQTFWCSDEVGGEPNTEISFEYVNDGYEDCGDGSDEPQDMDPSVDSDGDGDTTNDVDNWYDCMDEDGTTIPMDKVNDGTIDCPNGADQYMESETVDLDLPMPDPNEMGCEMGDEEEEEMAMPSEASLDGPDANGTYVIEMTMETDDSTCEMMMTFSPVGPDGNLSMVSMSMSNATSSISMTTWFDVDLEVHEEEGDDHDYEWGAADLTVMTTDHSLHMFDCGEAGVYSEDGEESSNTWIIFTRVNDDVADCNDESDEAVDWDGDGVSDVMFHCETPDDSSDDINMALVNDGNSGDCPNYSDEYMQQGSSYGTFNWDSTDSTPDGFNSAFYIEGWSDHDIDADELWIEILQVPYTDVANDTITEDGHCAGMDAEDKFDLSTLMSVSMGDLMANGSATTIDANSKSWTIYYLDNDEDGFVSAYDGVSMYSPDTTDLYFTCLEIWDDGVGMHTGDTPNLMPGFTTAIVVMSLISAALVFSRRDEE